MGSALSSPLLGIGLGMFGTGMQTQAAYDEANAANKAAEYNALVMERNAGIAMARAEDARQRGDVEADHVRMEGEQFKGQQIVDYAASGVRADSGSALDMQKNTMIWSQYNQDLARSNAAKEAWGYENEASNLRSQARFTRASKRNPYAYAGSYTITGATSAWNQYSQYDYRKVR